MTSNLSQLDGFFLVLDGAQAGPFHEAELKQLREQGRLSGTTYAWKTGMQNWAPASDLAAFDGFFASCVPPPVPPSLRSVDVQESGEAEEEQWFSGAPAPATKAPRSKSGSGEDDPFATLMAAEAANSKRRGKNSSEPPTLDPFRAMLDGELEADAGLEVGEQTRFFMIQAGMTQKQRNPPWKIALFVGLIIGIPALVLFVLSQVSVEQVYFDVETGRAEKVQVTALEEVSESFSDLRNKLLGEAKSAQEVEQAKVQRLRDLRKKQRRKGKISKSSDTLQMPSDVVLGTDDPSQIRRMDGQAGMATLDIQSASTDSERARAIYASDHRIMAKGPASRVPEKDAPALDGSPSLSPEVLSKVISNNQKAFQACVQNELRRNPGFKGGKIMLSLTIGSSGLVTATSIDKRDIDESVIGTCIKTSARRIVFPAFDGAPFTVEFPLLLSAGF